MTVLQPPDAEHDGGDARDPHLLAALHNAPDRDAAPTAQLSAAILAEARQALRGSAAAPSTTRWRAWQAAIDRLWQPAPMAAFGTLAMAAVIGVMWQGTELPDATPGLRPERAATPPTPVGTMSSDRAAAEPSTAARAGESASLPAAPAREAAPPVPPVLPHPSTSPTAQALNGAVTRAAKAAANEAPKQAPAARERPDAQASAQAPPGAAPSDETQPAQDAAKSTAPTPWPAQLQAPARASAPATAAADAARAAPQPPSLLARGAQPQPRASAESQPGRLAAAAAPTPLEPLAPAAAALDAALRSEPARVLWRVTPQRALAHDGERRAWWSALQSATERRWQTAAASPASVAATLLIDGVPSGSLRFEPQAVVWTDARGSAWRASLGIDDLRALQEPLARW